MQTIEEKILSNGKFRKSLTDIEKIKVRYALTLIRNEGVKLIIFFVLFFATGYIKEFLLCILIACTVRVFAGGIHMKTNIGCFLFSLVVLVSQIILLPQIHMPEICCNIALILTVGIICVLSPVESAKKPFVGRQRYLLCKRVSIISSIIWGIVLIFFIPDMHIKLCGAWVLIVQALQMCGVKAYHCLK
ncbi:MAG: accessory gene regulator B family protein [Clostridiales bacterium]|nr:accessory gene regulator B family protein [Clostridiales bacterium]